MKRLMSMVMLCSLGAAAQATDMGRVVVAQGEITINGQVVSSTNSFLGAGDTFKAASGAYAQLVTVDGTLLEVKGASLWRVDTYRYQPQAQNNELRIDLLNGNLSARTGDIESNGGRFDVITSGKALSPRGTHFEIELINGDMFLAVWDGAIDISVSSGSGTDTVSFGEGEDFSFGVINEDGEVTELLEAPENFDQGHSSDAGGEEDASEGASSVDDSNEEGESEDSSKSQTEQTANTGSAQTSMAEAEQETESSSTDSGDQVADASPSTASGGSTSSGSTAGGSVSGSGAGVGTGTSAGAMVGSSSASAGFGGTSASVGGASVSAAGGNQTSTSVFLGSSSVSSGASVTGGSAGMAGAGTGGTSSTLSGDSVISATGVAIGGVNDTVVSSSAVLAGLGGASSSENTNDDLTGDFSGASDFDADISDWGAPENDDPASDFGADFGDDLGEDLGGNLDEVPFDDVGSEIIESGIDALNSPTSPDIVANRTGIFTYSSLTDSSVSSSAGGADGLDVAMTVDFDTGYAEGSLSMMDNGGEWLALYAGVINGSDLLLDIGFATHGNNLADGNIDAFFADEGNKILGSFELFETDAPSERATGTFSLQ